MQRIQIRDLREAFRLGIFLRVAVVNAIHLRRLQNHFRADFIGAQGRRGVGRKIRIARAAAEDDLFQMPHGAPADERLGDLRHGDGALHARGRSKFFQRVLQCQRVDDCGEHSHVIARGALNAVFAAGRAAKNVPTTHHHHHFHAELAHFADLRGHVMHRSGTNANAMLITERFTA